MTLEDKQEPTVEQCLEELRQMFPKRWIAFDVAENHTIGPRGKHRMDGRAMVQVEAANGDLVYQSELKSVGALMAQVRRWYAGQKGLLFCSCGAACTEEEYAQHRKMGHDSGKEVK